MLVLVVGVAGAHILRIVLGKLPGSPVAEALRELLWQLDWFGVLAHDLGMQDAGLGNVAAVVVDIGRRWRISEQLVDAAGISPDEMGCGMPMFVIQRAPQHLQQVGSLGPGQTRYVAQVELSDREQRIRLDMTRMSRFEFSEVCPLFGVEEGAAGSVMTKPGRLQQCPASPDIVKGDRQVPVVVLFAADRPLLISRPQQRPADGTLTNSRLTRTGVQADCPTRQRSQLGEHRRDIDR
ncbi:hypothetical protein, partial [Nocardia araoensis]|uniref:hypothetical protein n=1 Tax=Nocardia araoensis TaxID=228600 RepID=UPI000584B725